MVAGLPHRTRRGLIPPPEEDRDGIQFDGTVLDRDHAGAKALQDDCPRSDFDAVLGKNYNFADEAWDGVTYRRYILRGELGRGGGLHVDPFREGFWHAHLQGRKRWMFMPESRYDWFTRAHPEFVREEVPARVYFEDYAPLLRDLDDVDDCDLEEGETLVCPHDVWHIVQHLSPHTASCSEQLLYDSNVAEVLINIAETALKEQGTGCFQLGYSVVRKCDAFYAKINDKRELFTAACQNDVVTKLFNRMCDEYCTPEAATDDESARVCEQLCGEDPGVIPNLLAA
ncbi:hypothetical protein TL16_g00060 [Triparma laevis f. inornata]|uniref:JmjC domain-containing protein n=1 Tax=Triparma laevis f. inornata TaxID=1714386 RepID=A0A9W6Z7Z3_9STRA|nr:hypothetical protein TL16_g00060 [Triparma laevis f. inornata]